MKYIQFELGGLGRVSELMRVADWPECFYVPLVTRLTAKWADQLPDSSTLNLRKYKFIETGVIYPIDSSDKRPEDFCQIYELAGIE